MTHTAISTGTFQPTLVARAPIVASPLSSVDTPRTVPASSPATPATPAGGDGGALAVKTDDDAALSPATAATDGAATPVTAWGTARLYEAGLRKQTERRKQPKGTREVWERTRYLPAGVCVAMTCGSTVERGSRASCDTYHALVSSPRTWRTRKLPPHLCLISLTDHRTAALASRCRLLSAPLPIVFFVYPITPDRDGIARECIKSSHCERLPPSRYQSLVPGSNHAAK